MEFYVRPMIYDASRCSLRRLQQGAQMAAGAFFSAEEAGTLYRVSTALRAFDPEKRTAAEFFQSALVCRAIELPLNSRGGLDVEVLRTDLSDFIHFAERFYMGIGMDDAVLQLSCSLPEAEGVILGWKDGFSAPFAGESATCAVEFSAADLASAPELEKKTFFIPVR